MRQAERSVPASAASGASTTDDQTDQSERKVAHFTDTLVAPLPALQAAPKTEARRRPCQAIIAAPAAIATLTINIAWLHAWHCKMVRVMHALLDTRLLQIDRMLTAVESGLEEWEQDKPGLLGSAAQQTNSAAGSIRPTP